MYWNLYYTTVCVVVCTCFPLQIQKTTNNKKKTIKRSSAQLSQKGMISEINAQHNRIILDGQAVATVGQLALLCSWQSFSMTKGSVAVTILKRRVILSVTQPGKCQAQ